MEQSIEEVFRIVRGIESLEVLITNNESFDFKRLRITPDEPNTKLRAIITYVDSLGDSAVLEVINGRRVVENNILVEAGQWPSKVDYLPIDYRLGSELRKSIPEKYYPVLGGWVGLRRSKFYALKRR